MNEELMALARKWRDEADAVKRDLGKVAPMQSHTAQRALTLCAEELEGLASRNVSTSGAAAALESRGPVKERK